MIYVAPGKKSEVIWQFFGADGFQLGCLISGHFDAVMKGNS